MIHKYTLKGLYIVLDVNSGAVHVVHKLIYDLLDFIAPPFDQPKREEAIKKFAGSYGESDISEAFDEIKKLFEADLLFSSDEEYDLFADKMTLSPVKAMCLHIAHDCNLRCEYCFASTGDFGEGRKMMPFETGKAAIDFLMKSSYGRHNLEIDFFGGEPLMNFDVVKEIVLYGREQEKLHNKNIRFTITTNGLLLDDDKIDFINKEMSNVVLSIDGRSEVTDRVRKTISGGGCYDLIAPKMLRLAEKRGFENYYVRGTFTKYNIDFTQDVKHLHNLGFDQISVEPVVSPEDVPYALTEADLDKIYTEYEQLADYILEQSKNGRPFNFFHFMLDLNQGPCAIKRLRGCGCGNEYVAVTPDGDIYPCHQFVGHEEWKMGNVHDGSFDIKMKTVFSTAHIYSKDKCKDCWAKFYCSGGCSANGMQYAGSIFEPHEISCLLEKKRLECAIMLKALEQ